MNYIDLSTEELLATVQKITSVLKDRLWVETMPLEQSDIIEMLLYAFRLDERTTRYVLDISSDGESSFDIEWRTPEKTYYRSYRNPDGNAGLPDESLLERAPVRWMENLLLGVYGVEAGEE